MKILILLSVLALSGCASYTTEHKGEFVFVNAKGIPDNMFVTGKAADACPNGYELISSGIKKDGIIFSKFRCL